MGPGSRLARPRHRLLDPKTAGRGAGGDRVAGAPNGRYTRGCLGLPRFELEPWPSNAGHSAINVRDVSPSLQALSAG